jgi:hypothetical protein
MVLHQSNWGHYTNYTELDLYVTSRTLYAIRKSCDKLMIFESPIAIQLKLVGDRKAMILSSDGS